MKVLSIRQPWAFAILALGKDVENRSWTTGHRGPLLVHASLEYDEEGEREIFGMGLEVPGYETEALKRGGIVGVVDLVASAKLTREVVQLGALPDHLSRIARSRWYRGPGYVGDCGWLLERPHALPFAPLKGQLSVFDIDEGRLPGETKRALEAWMAYHVAPQAVAT